MKILSHVFVAVLFSIFFTCCQTPQQSEKGDRFTTADTNHDGKLTQEEASNYFVAAMFEGRDANHDGKLTWEEWNVPGSGRSKKKFDAADTNKDGELTLAEAQAYAQKVGLFSKEFREADTNHDGYVTREEAKAYYASKEGPVR